MFKINVTDAMIDAAMAAEEAADGYSHNQTRAGLEAALEEAAPYRIEITDEMVGAFGRGWRAADEGGYSLRRRAGLRAALEAAGFRVAPDGRALRAEPVPPGPCPSTTEFTSAYTETHGQVRCDLRAGHAGDHGGALPYGGNVRWWDEK